MRTILLESQRGGDGNISVMQFFEDEAKCKGDRADLGGKHPVPQ